MVLFDLDAIDFPVEPEDLQGRFENGTAVDKEQLSARLGAPVRIRPLVSNRYSKAERLEYSKFSVVRLLQSYVVLQYATPEDAAAAKTKLQQDKSVKWVKESERVYFSSPNDPLYPFSAGNVTLDRQWGPSVLNLEGAWSNLTGNAYIGNLDNGIQTNHPDLQSNYRPHFSGNFAGGSTLDETEGGTFNLTGHGTHTAGIIAATTNNGTGVAGTCQTCSLMIGKVSRYNNDPNNPYMSDTYLADALNGMVLRGAQVINNSFGAAFAQDYCSSDPNNVWCMAISFAVARDVVIVASSGNNKTVLQFPAQDTRVIAVGGLQYPGVLWDQLASLPSSPAVVNFGIEIGSNFGINQTVVAPARDILSTFYTGYNWSNDFRCGTSISFPVSNYFPSGAPGFSQTMTYGRQYGICTGTSMSAPFITGIVGLMRSANPLLESGTIRTKLTQYASRAATPDQNWGYGIPNAGASVQDVLSTNGRLTPLFAFYNSDANDYFYTTVPQMAVAALANGLFPKPPGGSSNYYTYSWLGNYVSGYSSFPYGRSIVDPIPVPKWPLSSDNLAPRARLKIFTTPKDAAGTILYPLYRMSYVETAPGSTLIRHFYDASVAPNIPVGSVLDGIEGYVYPPGIAQPVGTIQVLRRYHPATTTFVIFPEDDLAYWTGQGFTGVYGSSVIGFAYSN